MFKNRLASHLERGVIGFPTTLASSVGLIMASPVILTVTSGFWLRGRYLCPCGITGIYYDASADYHLCRSGNAHSHDWLRLRLYLLRDGAFFSLSPVRFALT
ncbi:APC family amino acid permease [Salmonella enterica subsp. enterica]|uniref:APC family amino acid permease n=1 Tax=Salmonella enterica I TaxID=59201 RepID=A0A447TVI8_SALET|nr:APC family amino acid permease [Salmonella enterica subsp. enterica]